MIENKKKLNKRSLSVIITASVLVFLTVAYLVTNSLIVALKPNTQTEQQKADYIAEIGESYFGSYTLAYPSFSQSNVRGLVVGSHNGKYAMYRSEEDNTFFFCYEGTDGEMEIYYPDIVTSENTFDYTDLYAVEQSDGLNVYKLTYLFATLGTLIIDQRIPLVEDEAERAKQLNRYGLSESEKESIYVLTVDKDGDEVSHTIEIGDKLLAGTGYYFRVDGRDYVYTSSGTYLDYALAGFEGFISPNIVAEGLESDGIYEPYYTTDFQQWKNKLTRYDDKLSDTLQPLVAKNSKVIVKAKSIKTITDDDYFGSDVLSMLASDGYVRTDAKSMQFDLSGLSVLTQYDRVINLLENTRLGIYTDAPLVASAISKTLEVNFGEEDTALYEYEILKVEAVLTADAEYSEGDGYETVRDVDGATMVKVTYNYSVEGEKQNEIVRHAIVELNKLDADSLARISGAKIGESLTDFKITVNYDKATTESQGVTCIITDIALVFEENEWGGITYKDTVDENSAVTFRYYLMANGKKMTDEISITTEISELKEGNYLKIREALMGKSAGKGLNIEAFTEVSYMQIFSDFVTYEIESVDYFVEKELISSFEFQNASNRDSFYGESLYINTMGNIDPYSKYANYALNSTACEKVVCLLGGIGLTTSSNHSEGLIGSETVAIGLTPENMDKYGLYANTIYFELPRNIRVIEGAGEDELDDYEWTDTLGFTIYISDYNYEDGCRYIASDMYDIVVKYEGDDFDFLDMSFLDYYARRNVVLVNYANIKHVSLDFYMDDFFGGYEFATDVQTVWVGGGKTYLEKPENISTQEYKFLSVDASLRGANSGNRLTDYLTASGAGSMTLRDLYNAVASEEYGQNVSMMSGYSTLGAASFQDMLLLLFNTYYLGNLTEEEQKAGLEEKILMKLSFTVEGSAKDVYTYEFRRIDDRRVMVSIYNPGYNNTVSDFYITTFAFKKIVNNFDKLLNGVVIDTESAYR